MEREMNKFGNVVYSLTRVSCNEHFVYLRTFRLVVMREKLFHALELISYEQPEIESL